MELHTIRTRGNGYPQFVFMAWLMVILGKTPSEIAGSGPDYWIGASIIVEGTTEHINSDHPLLHV